MRQPILRANFRVGVFWWLGLTVWSSWGDRNLGEIWQAVADQGRYGLLGIVAGTAAVLIFSKLTRAGLVGYLASSDDNGISCSLGPVPKAAPFISFANHTVLPSRQGGDTKLAELQKFRASFTATHPEHIAFLDVILAIFAARMHLPATHVEGDHGYSTLFEHSLLVAGVMQETAPQWKYEGIKNKAGDVVIPLRRPDYHFKVDDPLVYLVGLAHDIGKIESYRYDDEGKLVGTRHEHDLVGARMLARIAAFWALPAADRDALTLAIGFYHHPQAMPLSEGGIARDDRTIALMELLITADKLAGKIESLQPYSGPSGELPKKAKPPRRSESPHPAVKAPAKAATGTVLGPVESPVDKQAPHVYQAFVELCGEADRINCPDHSTNIGQKYGQYLVFHGESLSKWLCRSLGVKDETLGDGRHKILDELMHAFEAKGMLYNEFEGNRYSASRAYWDVSFFSRSEKENGKPKPLRGWRHAVIIKPGQVLPGLTSLPDNNATMEVTRCSWSGNAAKNKRKTINEAEQAELLDAAKQDNPIMSLLQQRVDAEAAEQVLPVTSEMKVVAIAPALTPSETSIATLLPNMATEIPPWEEQVSVPDMSNRGNHPSVSPASSSDAASIMSDINLLFGVGSSETTTPAIELPPHASKPSTHTQHANDQALNSTKIRSEAPDFGRNRETNILFSHEKSVLETMTERASHRNQPLRRSKLEKLIAGMIQEPKSPLVLRDGWYKTYWVLLEPKLPSGLAAELHAYRDGFVPAWIRFEEHSKNGVNHAVVAFQAKHFDL